tara:strand:- start:4675 stop:6417 length:1743 start_codon:yes stop_codon:yes gene_type:complete
MTSFKVFIPCCDESLPIVKINSYLFNKFWPDLEVVYLGFKKPEYELYSANHTFVSLSDTQEGGSSKWTRYIHQYLSSIDDQVVMFSIDDYLLCQEPNLSMIDIAYKLISKNKNVGRFDLTFDSQVEGNIHEVSKLKGHTVAVKHPGAPYRISTQPALWKREYLLKFLDNDWSPWQFELNGTHMSSVNKFPEQTFCFYDKKMAEYPIRTIAKGAVSRHNPGKFNVLGMHPKLIKELVEKEFIVEKDLIWGQHGNKPPGFYEKGGYDFHPYLLDFHETSKTDFEEYFSVYDKDIMTVNLWDANFSHTLTHPEFGYVTAQGEYAKRTEKMRYVLRKNNFRYSSGITIFTDKALDKKIIDSVDCDIKIGWIQEPPIVHSFVYEKLPSFIDSLDFLLTFSKELAEKYDNCIEFPWCFLRVAEKDWGIHDKSKLVSMIASNKKWAPGHKLRHQIAENLSDKYDIDLWGGGFKEFPSLGKNLALNDYMYSIVAQNSQVDTFFTDFVDPLITGTVPIFWGTREVSNIFDPDGFIMFDTIDELEGILNTIGPEDYNKRLPAIKNNFEIAKRYWRVDDQLADKIKEILNL